MCVELPQATISKTCCNTEKWTWTIPYCLYSIGKYHLWQCGSLSFYAIGVGLIFSFLCGWIRHLIAHMSYFSPWTHYRRPIRSYERSSTPLQCPKTCWDSHRRRDASLRLSIRWRNSKRMGLSSLEEGMWQMDCRWWSYRRNKQSDHAILNT